MPTIQLQVGASEDDCAESLSGFASNGTSLQFGAGSFGVVSECACRFTNVEIPQGATITAATLEVRASANASTSVTVELKASDADDAVAPADGDEFSNETLTTATAAWSAPAMTSGTWYESQDLTSVIQEVVDRAGWASGNAMQIFIKAKTGTGNRNISAYDNATDPLFAPKLNITYSGGTPCDSALTCPGFAFGFFGSL